MNTPAKQLRTALFDEWLSPQELTSFSEFVMQHKSDFKSSQVARSDDVAYRRSVVLMNAGPFHSLFATRLRFYLPRILRALAHPFFDVKQIEAQITASNDGDYFRMHNDNTHADWPSRELTFVYFFYLDPKPFAGGELVFYDSPEGDREPVERHRFTPKKNSIIFFQSSHLHEILRVRCEPGTFESSRFTLNGWLHR